MLGMLEPLPQTPDQACRSQFAELATLKNKKSQPDSTPKMMSWQSTNQSCSPSAFLPKVNKFICCPKPHLTSHQCDNTGTLPIRSGKQLIGIKDMSENLRIRLRSLGTARRRGIDPEDDVFKRALEFFFVKQEAPPHLGCDFGWIAENGSHAEGTDADVFDVVVGCDP